MADNNPVIRKIVIPVPLLNEIKALYRSDTPFKPHFIVDKVMEKIDMFDSLAIHIQGIAHYKDFLSVSFSPDNENYNLFFNNSNWERIREVQNRHNIGVGEIVRLIFASCIYTDGDIVLPVAGLAELFFSQRLSYRYCLFMPPKVFDEVLQAEKSWLPINRENIFRAAFYFFYRGMGILSKPPKDEKYRFDNSKTGWIRVPVCGSLKMRDFLMKEKKETGRDLGIVINHMLHSFIGHIREAQ
jgi:hypothetical protein